MTGVLLGVGLFVVGAARKSPLGLVVAALGVSLGVRSFQRWRRPLSTDNARAQLGISSVPSSPSSEARDQVDEASWESFPSSDPPAFFSRNDSNSR